MGYCYIGKSDMQSAFRNLRLKVRNFQWLLLKAKSPIDGKTYWFVEKCLPFGASISCSHFQRFSDAIAHIVKVRNNGKAPINYPDDYFFIDWLRRNCNLQIRTFLDICELIKFPVSMEKTFWGAQMLTFLGLLIDTVRQMVCIPKGKVDKAREAILDILRGKKTTTVQKIQSLTGYLNFLCKCIVPGRAFTRRLYTFYSPLMKPHHHINIKREMREDLETWLSFLDNAQVYCRPFIDFSQELQAVDLDWYTDASGVIGIGGHLGSSWFQAKWDPKFLKECIPSISYQELYAVTVSILLWGDRFENKSIRLNCDNQGVVGILNNNTSNCKNNMQLVRIVVRLCLRLNLRVFAKHLRTEENNLADALSRFQMDRFWKDVKKEGRTMNQFGDVLPDSIWPVEKIWLH